MNKLMSLVMAAGLVLGACAAQHEQRASAPVAPESAAAGSVAFKTMEGQPGYATPEAALEALYKASAAGHLKEMAKISGIPEEDVVEGDGAKDAAHAAMFASAYVESHRIVPDPKDTEKQHAFIGKDNYPLASPLVLVKGQWFFDSAGGCEALKDRVIGENELATIGVCRAYVEAQYEYYSEDRNGDDVLQYAQRLGSNKGVHDGLYWKTGEGEKESPLGPLVADARVGGFLKGSARNLDEPKPYHGYVFRVLTRQGEHAAGGAYDYVINGRMVAGFALEAFPARYGKTGIMTFVVNANGKVYQKDLGEQTADVAGAMTEYDADSTWSLTQD